MSEPIEQPNLVNAQAGLRIVDALVYLANQHQGKRFSTLDPEVRGQLTGLAIALQAAYLNETWGGQGELHEGEITMVREAIAWARQAQDDQAYWSQHHGPYAPQS